MRLMVSSISVSKFKEDMELQDSANMLGVLMVVLPRDHEARKLVRHVRSIRNVKSHENPVSDQELETHLSVIERFLTALLGVDCDLTPISQLRGMDSGSMQTEMASVLESLMRESLEQPMNIFSDRVPARNTHFTGRRDELKAIAEGFARQEGVRARHMEAREAEAEGMVVSVGGTEVGGGCVQVLNQAVWGLGGMGKTAAAIEYCHMARASGWYRDTGIFWLNAASEIDLDRSFRDIAFTDLQLMKEPYGNIEDENVKAIIRKDVLDILQARSGWLLVIDNADEPAWLGKYCPAVQAKGHVLLTSR